MQQHATDTKKILFCPLDWGLGHASRDIYIIRKLLETNRFKLILAADGGSYHLLRNNFPDLQILRFPFINISYSKNSPASVSILFQLPKIFISIWKEHRKLKFIIKEHNIDIVISDNRFGLYNRTITSVYITHQLKIKVPLGCNIFQSMVYKWHLRQVKKYDYCWIPDFPGKENLGGALSHPERIPSNVSYIGPISRFMQPGPNKTDALLGKYDILVVLSGPEPQRTILEKILIKSLRNRKESVLILQGLPWLKNDQNPSNNIHMISHLPTELFREQLLNSRFLICRPGYSSIMDLNALGKTAILIPTPGQTEQEYLAEYLSDKRFFLQTTQENPNFDLAFSIYNQYQPSLPKVKKQWLETAINKLS